MASPNLPHLDKFFRSVAVNVTDAREHSLVLNRQIVSAVVSVRDPRGGRIVSGGELE
jgi:hypothetical protein